MILEKLKRLPIDVANVALKLRHIFSTFPKFRTQLANVTLHKVGGIGFFFVFAQCAQIICK